MGLEKIFSGVSFEDIQKLLFPVVKSLGGPDIEGAIIDKADVLTETALFLDQLATLCGLAGESLADGLLTDEELEALISGAESLPEALEGIIEAWKPVAELDG